MGSNLYERRTRNMKEIWSDWNLLNRDKDLSELRDVLAPGKDILNAMESFTFTSTRQNHEFVQNTEWLSIFCRMCFVKESRKKKLSFLNDMDMQLTQLKANALSTIQ